MIKISLRNSEKYSLFVTGRNWRMGEVNSAHLLPMIFPETEIAKIHNLEALIDKLLVKEPYVANSLIHMF